MLGRGTLVHAGKGNTGECWEGEDRCMLGGGHRCLLGRGTLVHAG